MKLRDYQLVALERLRANIRTGIKNQILCAPTGSGKTVIAAFMMDEAAKKYKRVLFVVDRLSLLNQTSQVLDDYGIGHGIIQGSHWRKGLSERIKVCSQQTLARRDWPDADLIIVDEAHTVTETTRKRISKRDAVVIGLTATPFTKDLGKLYDAMVNVTTTDELIAQGWLSNYRIFAATEPDMQGVKVVAGEWDEKETSKRAMEVVGDCVAEYLKHGEGKKFICSAVDTAHVDELHRQFMSAGIHCAAYTYKVDDDEREQIVNEFKKPDSYIRGLITVTAASKGFDVPDIGVVIMARPLRKSLAEHIQFFGRGLRSHPGKDGCIVLDHSGNSARFWDDWTAFFAQGASALDDGKKREKPKTKPADEELRMVKCPECAHLHIARPSCPHCGYEYPRRIAVQHVPGTLTELVATGNRRLMTTELWPQVASYARRMRDDPEKARKLALALYKQITDTWPTAEFSNTPDAPISNAVLGKIRSLNIAYSRRPKAEVHA